MGLLSILTGGISEKYEAVQQLANALADDEAARCYSIALGQLCIYLDNPFDPSAMYNKTAYVEAVVALYERLRGSDSWFSMNKGSFRLQLTKSVLSNFTGKSPPTIRRLLDEYDFEGDDRDWSSEDSERLGWHVQEMLAAGP